jgi:hypothetical protein
VGSPPLVLLGAQRSGTTALASILDAGFDAADGTFTVNGKLPYLLHRWCTAADIAGRHLRADEIMHALVRKPPYGRRAGPWLERVEKVLRAAAARVADGEIDDAVMLRQQIVADSYADASRYGEKYNEYLLELDLLSQTMPDARWVLLVRHPVAVADSMARWAGDRPWRPRDRAAGIGKWVAWHTGALRHPWITDSTRCTVLEYSRLCAGEDLSRLSDVIDLDLAPYATDLAERPGEPDPHLPSEAQRLWRDLLDLRPA